MELNPDCIRDIMLAIESMQSLDSELVICHTYLSKLAESERLAKYPKEDIAYTLLKLSEGKLINATPSYGGGKILNFYVSDLTFDGHQYLDKIRDAERWKTVKSVGNKIGDFSLSAIEKIAEGVTSAAISKLFSAP
ncbi:hypothetical protein CAFE_23470 [Caprobacter fermentans]|uniref:DUF2513 domain-containing protein n=1 Tax=Caproicibacter fermentans TaxID=2576756 RepID=A0A6N8I194_9FIRM|nr:DUF2513 domain-containing protein [Caproicibacter fermentans]MVB11625.1 hypothetical protein [Caproicibacter fermentans]